VITLDEGRTPKSHLISNYEGEALEARLAVLGRRRTPTWLARCLNMVWDVGVKYV
jgi:hypothetical protein